MDNSDLLRFKNLLVSKRQELSDGRGLADSITAAGGLRGDTTGMANGEADAAMQIRLRQTDGKLLRAVDDALTRILRQEYGICAECGEPISKARLEAVPWTTYCRDCNERRCSRG